LRNRPSKQSGNDTQTTPAPPAGGRPITGDILALAAGGLLPLAFAPFYVFALAVASPAVLFALWLDSPPGRAAWRGLLFGLGMFGVGTSWVYVSLHTYGNMPAPLAALAVLFFTLALAAFPALAGWLQSHLVDRRKALPVILVLPALWVLLEWLRGWVLSGFPWLNLGYSQASSPLAGLASWAGVYGVSLAVAVSAALVLQAWRERQGLWGRYLVALAVLWAGAWFVGRVPWVQASGEALRIALVQGNVPIESKWRPENRPAIVERYIRLSEQAGQSDLIVWPETAMPGYLDEIDPVFLERLRRRADEGGGEFLIGVVEKGWHGGRGTYYNTVVGIGSRPAFYRKRHLVPFGEFLPLRPALEWVLRYLHIPMSDFTAGEPDQPPLEIAGHRIGVSVCYEDAFGEELIQALPQATLLVNVSEDAWFGRSLAPHQRLQMARMRAMESGRPMLRAANTGPSAVIDHRGEVLARSPQFQAHVLTARVQPTQGATPYVRFGNWPTVLLIVGVIAGAWVRRHA